MDIEQHLNRFGGSLHVTELSKGERLNRRSVDILVGAAGHDRCPHMARELACPIELSSPPVTDKLVRSGGVSNRIFEIVKSLFRR